MSINTQSIIRQDGNILIFKVKSVEFFQLVFLCRILYKGTKPLCFEDRKLNLLASVWKKILWNLTKFQLNQILDKKYGNRNCMNALNMLKFCEVSQDSFSNRSWKYQLSILKNKGRSLYIGQESSNRWFFAIPILREGFDHYLHCSWNSINLASTSKIMKWQPGSPQAWQGSQCQWIFNLSSIEHIIDKFVAPKYIVCKIKLKWQ